MCAALLSAWNLAAEDSALYPGCQTQQDQKGTGEGNGCARECGIGSFDGLVPSTRETHNLRVQEAQNEGNYYLIDIQFRNWGHDPGSLTSRHFCKCGEQTTPALSGSGSKECSTRRTSTTVGMLPHPWENARIPFVELIMETEAMTWGRSLFGNSPIWGLTRNQIPCRRLGVPRVKRASSNCLVAAHLESHVLEATGLGKLAASSKWKSLSSWKVPLFKIILFIP